MNKPLLEKEVKFYLTDLSAYENRLRSLGAALVQPRTRELNYRFDTSDLSLTRSQRVLRLRKDKKNILTYKGPSQTIQEVFVRPEIELEVHDFDKAIEFLGALGYSLVVQYEKWRTSYRFNELEITLDEMPFGDFSEIEGSDADRIRSTAALLALSWDCRINDSYLSLFDYVKRKLTLDVENLTFEAFNNIPVSPADLGVKPADTPRYL